MYETATTLQFRKAVRKVAAKRDLLIYDSHTNRSTIPGRRTVGFSMQGATPELAAKIEKKLNEKGLTAWTRQTDSGCAGHGSGRWYIRGTCTLS